MSFTTSEYRNPRIVIIGEPNSGRTSLFNILTGNITDTEISHANGKAVHSKTLELSPMYGNISQSFDILDGSSVGDNLTEEDIKEWADAYIIVERTGVHPDLACRNSNKPALVIYSTIEQGELVFPAAFKVISILTHIISHNGAFDMSFSQKQYNAKRLVGPELARVIEGLERLDNVGKMEEQGIPRDEAIAFRYAYSTLEKALAGYELSKRAAEEDLTKK